MSRSIDPHRAFSRSQPRSRTTATRPHRPDAPTGATKVEPTLCYLAAGVCFLAAFPIAEATESFAWFAAAMKMAALFLLSGWILAELIGLRRDLRALNDSHSRESNPDEHRRRTE